MTIAPHILAAANDEGSRLTLILVVIGIAVVFILSKIAERARKAREQAVAARRAEEERVVIQAARPGPAAPAGRPGGMPPARPGAPRPSATPPPFIPPPMPQAPPRRVVARPATTVEERVRTVRDATDLDQVDEEVGRMRQVLDQKVDARRRRMTTAAPAESDTGAIDARISHFQRMEVTAEQAARFMVDLSNPAMLRAAIVCHEIFSPPKALRQGPELWDK